MDNVTYAFGTGILGGLVGVNGGSITGINLASGSITGGTTSGGLVGINNGSIAAGSAATGSVSGGYWVGGFAGYNTGSIIGSVALGGSVTATAPAHVGGLERLPS
jgi:hypothetical protein